jgi:hypothetical protein
MKIARCEDTENMHGHGGTAKISTINKPIIPIRIFKFSSSIAYSVFLKKKKDEPVLGDWQSRRSYWMWILHTADHCCFLTLPTGTAHSPQGLSENMPQSWYISLKTHAVLLCMQSWSLLLLCDIATRGSTVSEDYWTQTGLMQQCLLCSEVMIYN